VDAADDALRHAADSIAAGDGVDWQQLQEGLDPDRSRVLSEMQILERIATFLRTDTPDTSAEVAEKQSRLPTPGEWAHFTLLELIGQGGFGSVYRARDTKLQTDVALKLIELPAGRDVRPTTALKEARLLARVRHTNVVNVYGADIVDGRAGIWMQLIEGRTLSALLRQNGPFNAHEAALVAVDLCRALAAVHGAGLIHGDVKTRNVMREAGGRTVLMDFGTGTDLFGLRLHGAANGVAGTPLYLAPEVFGGAARSRVTDTYSLGVLLFHLVTDTYPVKGQTQGEIEDAHQLGKRTSLRDARSDLPQAFVAVVERAIAPDPAERFQTAGAFERALTDFLGQPMRVDPPRTQARWIRIAAAAAIVAAIGAGAFLLGRRGPAPGPATATPPAATASAAAAYTIETALFARRPDGETRLKAGDRIAPGDALFMRLRVTSPTYVYVVNEDDAGDAYLLFPLPGHATENPLAAGTLVRVPGVPDQEISWQVTSRGGREHFLFFASPERLQGFEEVFASLPKPTFGAPVISAKISPQSILKLRSVGGLVATGPAPASKGLAAIFTTPLAPEGQEQARGLWIRQLTVANAPAR